MTIGTPDSPRPVNSPLRARRFFTRAAGVTLIAPAIIVAGIALAAGASAAEPAANATTASASNAADPQPSDVAPTSDAAPTCPTDGTDITNVSYLVDGHTFTTLVGNVAAGASVTVNFTIADGCTDDQFSLAAYKATAATYSDATAASQTLSDSATGSFGAGEHSLKVTVPACYFQIDFVRGAVIAKLTAGAYATAGHLIDHDNGGTTSCTPTTKPTDPVKVLGETITKTPTATVAPAAATLPFTGGSTGLLLALGTGLLIAGTALRLLVTRRFTPRRR